MIRKINSARNFGSLETFDWDAIVRDPGNNIVYFNKLNILYGRNYSGKTTISRIFGAIENNVIPSHYPDAWFELENDERKRIASDAIEAENLEVRVYNSDFIRQNLSWIIDESGDIKPFAILGEKNVETEKKRSGISREIGDDTCGLVKERIDAESVNNEKQKSYLDTEQALDEKLRKKAQLIKLNASIYGQVSYNINSIKQDISTINFRNEYILKNDEIEKYESIIRETVKEKINPIAGIELRCAELYIKANELLNKEIKPSKSIQDLLKNDELQEWVRNGTSLHRGKRNSCAFCGNELPADLWDRLDLHFNKQSEQLRDDLLLLCEEIDSEFKNVKRKIAVPGLSVYSEYRDAIELAVNKCNDVLDSYKLYVTSLKNEVKKRVNSIFTAFGLELPKFDKKSIIESFDNLNKLISLNNGVAAELSKRQMEAKIALRLHAVAEFVRDIMYVNEIDNIKLLKEQSDTSAKKFKEINDKILSLSEEIRQLETELTNERRGAEKVNDYLNHYFGHDTLTLEAEEHEAGYKFVLKRKGEIAKKLSEGECRLVSFCYFMAKLEDSKTHDRELIIFIDDPISSLDSNHTFFVFSLIEGIIAKEVNYEQLFISTHSLEFFKYLKKLTRPKIKIDGKQREQVEFFIVYNDAGSTKIGIMPHYLKKFVTEFNYLFDIIYKCSTCDATQYTPDSFYNFGNDLRKFLESFLFFKYPDQSTFNEKMIRFFDNDVAKIALISRLIHELSHLAEYFDRGVTPIEIPEIKKIAQCVLDQIMAKDHEQYQALIRSIGV